MKCEPCNGSGLADQHNVCSVCRGLGHDGSIAPEAVVVSVPSRVRKAASAVKKAVKRK